MASEISNRRKKIVIVGGGIAGSLVAKSLQFSADLILIDPKEYMEIPWARLRSMVEPSFAERTLIKHSDYLKNGKIIISSAIDVTENAVRTEDGRLIEYDFLVIATGRACPMPQTIQDRLMQYKEDYEKIRSAKSVLIIGGGPTGVELAGEITTEFPEKYITLVHKGDRLIEFIGPKASDKAINWLLSKKIDVFLNQTVNLDGISDGDNIYKTTRGETINADCPFVCTGKPLESSWLMESILKERVDEFGRLKVDENLRVRGFNNIFAIGDITDVPEIKQGFYAQKHAQIVAKNLKILVGGDKESKMATYKAGPKMAFVSLGRKHAVAQLPFMTSVGVLPGMIKSKNLFVRKVRKHLGLDP